MRVRLSLVSVYGFAVDRAKVLSEEVAGAGRVEDVEVCCTFDLIN